VEVRTRSKTNRDADPGIDWRSRAIVAVVALAAGALGLLRLLTGSTGTGLGLLALAAVNVVLILGGPSVRQLLGMSRSAYFAMLGVTVLVGGLGFLMLGTLIFLDAVDRPMSVGVACFLVGAAGIAFSVLFLKGRKREAGQVEGNHV
jgi:hypothetical protein